MGIDFSKINKRYIGSLMIIPIIISLILGGMFLKIVMFTITILSLIEFSNVFMKKNLKINICLLIFFAIIYYILGIEYINILVLLFLLVLLCFLLDYKNHIIDISLSFIAVFYIVIPFSFIFILSEINNYLPWIVFLCAWTTDTMAYVIGKNFGRHKLIERISPNKTIEGFAGGVISCIIVIVLYGTIFMDKLDIPIINLILLSFIIGVIGQIGDLIASSIKRFVDIKDFSNLIPGHGGILDRFDSILLISIVVFIYSQIFI